jgi:hypothetical protein
MGNWLNTVRGIGGSIKMSFANWDDRQRKKGKRVGSGTPPYLEGLKMDKNYQMLFRSRFEKVWLFYMLSIIIASGEVMFISGLISSPASIVTKIIVTLIAFFCLVLGVYCLIFPIVLRLKFFSWGIIYTQPLYSVSCEWKNLSGIYLTPDELYIFYDQQVLEKASYIQKAFIGQRRIPLHLFVHKFYKAENWKKDQILLEMQKHIPNFAEELASKLG